MRATSALLLLPVLALAVSTGCGSEDQLKRVEQEVGDMKLEVFKLRQQMEDANRKLDAEVAAANEARNQDRDLQETLRQVQDSTRALNNKVGSLPRSPLPRTSADPAPGVSEDEKAFGAAQLDYNRGRIRKSVV